jgi:hypothetical protein
VGISIYFLSQQGHVRKNWKKRYFELTDSELTYYTKQGGEIRGAVTFSATESTHIEKLPSSEPMSKKKGNFLFIVTNGKDRIVASADTMADMESWVEAIRYATSFGGRQTTVMFKEGHSTTSGSDDEPNKNKTHTLPPTSTDAPVLNPLSPGGEDPEEIDDDEDAEGAVNRGAGHGAAGTMVGKDASANAAAAVDVESLMETEDDDENDEHVDLELLGEHDWVQSIVMFLLTLVPALLWVILFSDMEFGDNRLGGWHGMGEKKANQSLALVRFNVCGLLSLL